MKFQEHLDACEHCRTNIFDLCPEGKQILRAEAGAIPDSMQASAQAVAHQGRDLAMHLLDHVIPNDFDPPVLVYALAYLFAGLLSAADGHQSTYEKMGLGLLSDSHRLGMFCDQVKEMVTDIRALRPKAQSHKGVM